MLSVRGTLTTILHPVFVYLYLCAQFSRGNLPLLQYLISHIKFCVLVSSKIISYVAILLFFCEMYLQSIENIICYIITNCHYMYPYIKYNMYRKVMFLHAPTPRRCGHVAEWAIGVAVQPTKLAYCFSNMLHFQILYISNIGIFQ